MRGPKVDPPPGLRVDLVPSADLDVVAPRWLELERRSGPVPVMRSWVWTSAWVRAYGAEVGCRFAFVVRVADGETVGATLVTEGTAHRGPVPLRVLWLGTGDLPVGSEAFPDANGPVALPDQDAAVVRALVASLTAEGGWDELRLTGAEREDARRLASTWPSERVRVQILGSSFHDLDLHHPDGDVTLPLSRSHRRNVRRTLRAYERVGELTVEWATTAGAGREILDELMELHQARWTADGRPGGFARPESVAFHRELVERLADDGRVALSRVRCDGETVATTYGFVDGTHLRCYQTGLVPPPGGRLRPGVLGDLLMMAEARRRGLSTYDFLPGSPAYKATLSTGEGERWRVALRRRRARLLLVDALSLVRSAVRRARRLPPASDPGWTRLPPQSS